MTKTAAVGNKKEVNRITIRFTDHGVKIPGLDPAELAVLNKHSPRVMAWLQEAPDNPRRFALDPHAVIARVCPELRTLIAKLPARRVIDPRQVAPPGNPDDVRFTVGPGRRSK